MKRREFLHRLLVGAAALGASRALTPRQSLAQVADARIVPQPRALSVPYRTIAVKGRAGRVFGLVQPDGTPGRWPLHCHHLYHMATGMMAYVTYDGIG